MPAAALPQFAVLGGDQGAATTEAERVYGGALRFPAGEPHVVFNFVSTVDGVVSLGIGGGVDASTISGRSEADRFLMAMLRAAADVVVIGAGTLRATPGHQWVPRALAPAHAGLFDAYRRSLGKRGSAPLVVVSATGMLPRHVALDAPATHVIVLTAEDSVAAARDSAPQAQVISAGSGERLDGAAIARALYTQAGAGLVLSEGGPTLFGTLLAAQRADELFLTPSPRLAGAAELPGRRSLVEGWAASPDSLRVPALSSVRRSGDHLFLRYRLS